MPALESPVPGSSTSNMKVKAENRQKNITKARRVLQKKRNNGSDDDNDDFEDNNAPKKKENVQEDENMTDGDDEESRRDRKRVRGLNGHARRPSEAVGSDHEVEETIDYDQLAMKVFERDPVDGYVPGSIVRIACHQFLTYDFVQFSPGPRMNMILGPNGTGKSTIACAICIGLGFNVGVLGRATDISAFIKHGYSDGWVEIELKGSLGKPNTVIRRTIKSRSSSWLLNGKSRSQKDVMEEVHGLGIQITNLCSFLPQDRVNEFARLKPDELLVETQKVAGHHNLNDWHEQLIDLGKRWKEVKEVLAADKEQCENEKGKNSILERDVAAFHKRKELEEELQLYELLIPWYQCKADRNRVKALKLQWKETGLKLSAALAEHQPAIDFKQRLEDEVEKAGKGIRTAENEIKKLETEVKKLKRQDDEHAASCEEIQNTIVDLRKDEGLRQRKIREYRDKIKTTKAKLEDPQNQPEDSSELEVKSAETVRSLQQVTRQRNSLRHDLDERNRQLENIEEDVTKASAELKKLEDVKNQRYNNMKNRADPRFRAIADEDFMKIFEWLGENRHQFTSAVEPACFSVNVSNPEMAYAIEALIPPAAGKTFVFSNREDYELFNVKINDEKVCGRVHVTVWYRPDPEKGGTITQPEHSQDTLRAAGFDGYAIDFIEAPQSIKWFLCKQYDLHRVPIARDTRNINPDQAAQMFAPQNPGAQNRYITGWQMNSINRSAYGKRLVQNNTSNVNKPVWYNTQPVDKEKQRRCRETIGLGDERKREIEAEMRQIQEKDGALQTQQTELGREGNALKAKKEEIAKKALRLKQWRTALNSDQEALTSEENKPSLDQQETNLKRNLLNKINLRIRAIPNYKKVVGALNEHTTKLTHATFELIQASADVAAMDKIVKSYTARHRQLEEDVQRLEQEWKALQEKTKAERQQLEILFNQSTAAVVERHTRWTDEHGDSADLDQLEQKKVDIQSQINMTTRVNQSVIQTYEERKRRIEHLGHSIERKEKENQNIEKKITKVKEKWYPQLKALINRVNGRFSAAFDRIKCAGEVHLAEHEDFDKWSIEILVKFRSNEPLQLLTGQRQSGGERSLTTILYLMSLTGLAKTPFALVDEINQGMDVKYERAVHNELIQVTCAEDSGQYFLITPKLLPNLTYHENVTTLVINNGDWLPETRDEKGNVSNYGDLGAHLKAYRRAIRT